MMNRQGWLVWVLLAVACGGKSLIDGGSTDSAGGSRAGADSSSGGAPTAGDASAGNSGAGNSGAGAGGATCPDNLPDTTPTEGAACPRPGLACPGYGSLSCPLTAVCSANSTWQINCPSVMLFGACSCPHHDYGRVPDVHRATALDCSHTRAASPTHPNGGCSDLDGGVTCPNSTCCRSILNCNEDSQCVDSRLGENGRCVERLPMSFFCTYDACFADSACAEHSVCQCRAPSDGVEANYCTVPSNCRVDADCGQSGYCSPSRSHEWCGTFYACHTPEDECLNDGDCGTGTNCDFDVDLKHWVCGNLCGPLPH